METWFQVQENYKRLGELKAGQLSRFESNFLAHLPPYFVPLKPCLTALLDSIFPPYTPPKVTDKSSDESEGSDGERTRKYNRNQATHKGMLRILGETLRSLPNELPLKRALSEAACDSPSDTSDHVIKRHGAQRGADGTGTATRQRRFR